MSTRRVLVVLLGAALAAGGCSILDGSSPNPPAPPPGPPTAEPESTVPPVPVVANPWRPGRTELGVNVYWEDSKDDDDTVTRAKAARILDYLVTLNANSVALNFPFVMDGLRSSRVEADRRYTPSPERVRIFLEEAAVRKLRATVRPLLDERTLIPDWRGEIAPADRDAWFASYRAFLRPYAQAAQATGTAEFVVGVELNSLQRDSRWKRLVAAVRTVYDGALTYSINFDVYQRGLSTPPVDAVGVDAYFAVDESDRATVAELTRVWTRWVDRYAGDDARDLVLHEVGIAAQDGAYEHPAQWGSASRRLNLTVQKNWYAAVCSTVEKRKLAGVYFWNVRMHHDPGNEDPRQDDRLTFVDRPAETVLRDCYGRMAAV